VLYQNDGKVSDQNLALKKAKEGSEELFNRLRELGIIKPVKVNFKITEVDPEVRIEYIRGRVEEVVTKIFGMKR
jgi:hypothetical protein